MKIPFLLFALFIASIGMSQTAVISNKSHSGDLSKVIYEPDNFGGRMDAHSLKLSLKSIDTVVLIDECIIEYGSTFYNDERFQDTVCDNESLRQHGYSLDAARQIYNGHVTFIGFNEDVDDNSTDGSEEYWHNGSLPLFLVLLLSYFGYLISPAIKKK